MIHRQKCREETLQIQLSKLVSQRYVCAQVSECIASNQYLLYHIALVITVLCLSQLRLSYSSGRTFYGIYPGSRYCYILFFHL